MRERLARAATFPASRVGKWVTLAAWLVVLVALGPLAAQFEDAQENRPSSFLPGSSESVEALDALAEFPSGEVSPAIVVYRNPAGLTEVDRALVAADRQALNAQLPEGTQPVPPVVISEDGTAALLTFPITSGGDSDVVIDAVDEIRDVVGTGTGGLQIAVTGPAGFTTDAVAVFDQINTTLLLATAGLVFVLLVLIYRSPIFWMLPLAAVLFAEWTTRALGYTIAEAGAVVNGQTAGILLVLVFGAGTDYALLVTARYREELRRHEDRHEAMTVALRRGGPAILASAGTNILALLCLGLASVDGTAGLGPVGAMGIAVAMIAMLTALPSLLVISGRRAFWPRIPRYGSEVREASGFFRRLGDRIGLAPRRVWIGTAVVLGILALGTSTLDTGLTQADDFRGDVESVAGQELLSESSRQGQQLRRRSSSRLRPLRRPSSPFARACSKIPPLRALVQPSAAHRGRCLI
jgi:RND superfamily putative drug exporter